MRGLVTGLPRSRTAWFTCLLAAVGCDTCHELKPRFGSVSDLKSWMRESTPERPHVYIDGTFWAYPGMIEIAKDMFDRTLVIQRNRADAVRSWIKWNNRKEMTPAETLQIFADYDKMLSELPHQTLRYENMDGYWDVAQAVDFVSGKELPYATFRLFNVMKIELIKEKVWKDLNELAARERAKRK